LPGIKGRPWSQASIQKAWQLAGRCWNIRNDSTLTRFATRLEKRGNTVLQNRALTSEAALQASSALSKLTRFDALPGMNAGDSYGAKQEQAPAYWLRWVPASSEGLTAPLLHRPTRHALPL